MTVRTSAASLALPSSRPGQASRLRLQARVGRGDTLRWLPGPHRSRPPAAAT